MEEYKTNYEDHELLPVSAIAEYIYCPRNFYYRVVEGAKDSNAHVLEGKFQEENREQRHTQKRGDVIQRRSVKLSSEKMGLIAEVDAVDEAEEVYPVDTKRVS